MYGGVPIVCRGGRGCGVLDTLPQTYSWFQALWDVRHCRWVVTGLASRRSASTMTRATWSVWNWSQCRTGWLHWDGPRSSRWADGIRWFRVVPVGGASADCVLARRMFSGGDWVIFCLYLHAARSASLLAIRGRVGRSVCLWLRLLAVSRRMLRRRRRHIGPAAILKGFLLVLQQGPADRILHQSPADSQQLCLVWLGPAASTCGNDETERDVCFLWLGMECVQIFSMKL